MSSSKVSAMTTISSANRRDGCPKTDVERILEYQRKMFETKLKQLRQSTSTQANPTTLGVQPTMQQSAVASSSRNTNNNKSQTGSKPIKNPSNFKPPKYKAQSEMNLFRLSTPNKPKPKEKGQNLIVETFQRRDDERSSSGKKQPHRRNRSVSRSHSKPDRDEGMNCPTCKKLFGVYIYQCSNGHSSCKDCKLKSANCGLCSKPITETRNITLESYLAERIIACPNTADGCWLYSKLVDMDAHLKECPFNELACPVETCSWRGKLPKLSQHFDEIHPEHCQSTADTEVLIPNIKSNKTTMHLVEIGPYKFIIRVKYDENRSNIYMVAQLYGTSVSASKWSYKFHISNGAKMYEYSDVCVPNFVAAEDIYKQAKCAVLPIDFAMNFVKEDCLSYKFSLNKDIPTWKHGFGATSWKNK